MKTRLSCPYIFACSLVFWCTGALAESITYQVVAGGGNFHLNGEEKPTLTVTRGDTLTFNLDALSSTSHSFALGLEPEVGADGLAIPNNNVTFHPPGIDWQTRKE